MFTTFSVVSVETAAVSFDVDVAGLEVEISCDTIVDALLVAAVVMVTTGENDEDDETGTEVSAARVLEDDIC